MTESIFIDENIPFLSDILSGYFDIKLFKGRELTAQELIINNCSALFIRSTAIVNSELLSGTNVKFVATATSGIDHIDTEYLKSKNICFASALGSNSNSVAEYVIYSIMKWAFDKSNLLKDKTIGIIGFGNIGTKVGYYADLLGMKVLVNDPPLKDSNYIFPDYIHYCELAELLKNSDIITNHVPLNNSGNYSTLNLLDDSNLNLIKNKSLFIHCSRGKVVNEVALLNSIKNKDISLVIDVFENEPIANKELSERAIFATPHIAGYSRDGKIIGVLMVLNAFAKFKSMKFDLSILTEQLNNDTNPLNINANEQLKIYTNIQKSRNIEADSEQFKNIFNSFDTAKEFDLLRKHYPPKREYLQYKK